MQDLQKYSKKDVILLILEILKRETDSSNRMRQNEMVEKLFKEYGVKVDRKTVSRNLCRLRDEMGYDIEYAKDRSFWLSRADFDLTELRLLVDSIRSNQYINDQEKEELIYKVSMLGNKHFKSCMKNIVSGNPSKKRDVNELFENLSIVDEAITRKRKIAFKHNIYGEDKKLHWFRNARYSDDIYHEFSPYKIVYKDNRYYVIGNSQIYSNGKKDHLELEYYPLDMLTELDIIPEVAEPFELPDGFDKNEDFYNHFTQIPEISRQTKTQVKLYSIYTYVGVLEEVFMTFGNDVLVKYIKDDEVDKAPVAAKNFRYRVEIKTDITAIIDFAVDKMGYVYVDDELVRKRLKEMYSQGLETYK